MRLDKYLCDTTSYSRSEIREIIKKGRVTVNGTTVKAPDLKINEAADLVNLDGKGITYERFVYFMLNKPADVVSATKDNFDTTVLDLFKDENTEGLFTVGRLDKDTTGLLIVTNDGELSHRLTSSKYHVYKNYIVTLCKPIDDDSLERLREGVELDDGMTLPAVVTRIDEAKISLKIREGRFHQVKRMMIAVGNEVLSLHRAQFGSLKLDDKLKPGEYRRLTEDEVNALQSDVNAK